MSGDDAAGMDRRSRSPEGHGGEKRSMVVSAGDGRGEAYLRNWEKQLPRALRMDLASIRPGHANGVPGGGVERGLDGGGARRGSDTRSGRREVLGRDGDGDRMFAERRVYQPPRKIVSSVSSGSGGWATGMTACTGVGDDARKDVLIAIFLPCVLYGRNTANLTPSDTFCGGSKIVPCCCWALFQVSPYV